MSLNKLCKEAYENARAKGWHQTPRSPLEIHALIHSEISEATEAVRDGKDSPLTGLQNPSGPNPIYKPEGELIELADAIIRIADYCGSKGWDLDHAVELKMQYNKTRPHRHGGKTI